MRTNLKGGSLLRSDDWTGNQRRGHREEQLGVGIQMRLQIDLLSPHTQKAMCFATRVDIKPDDVTRRVDPESLRVDRAWEINGLKLSSGQ